MMAAGSTPRMEVPRDRGLPWLPPVVAFVLVGFGVYVATARAEGVIVGPAPPVVTLIVASSEEGLFVQHGVPGQSVSIYGERFAGVTSVRFGSQPAIFRVVAPGYEIEAVAPTAEGTVDVTVTTPAGTSTATYGDRFTYAPASAPVSAPTVPVAVPTAAQPPGPVVAAHPAPRHKNRLVSHPRHRRAKMVHHKRHRSQHRRNKRRR
jgi:hypothetical protein